MSGNCCARCSTTVSGLGYIGPDGTSVYCGNACRNDDVIEIAAKLISAQPPADEDN